MIGIIGGGPGGLTLARVLHVHGIEAVVYERDASRAARVQGGPLDLHADTGQRALRLAGLEAEFLAVARPEGQDMRLLDHHGKVLLQEDVPDDAPLARPEVDRGDLRDILLDALAPDAVVWGREFRHATALPGGGYRLHFADGGTADHELIVGADGAKSRVRPLLMDVQPRHAGLNYVEGAFPAPGPELAARLGRGSYWAMGEGRSMSTQRLRDGGYRVAFGFHTPADWLATVLFDDEDSTRAALKDLYAGWAPELVALIDLCVGGFEGRSILTMPAGLTWAPVPGVTLIGDAAHLMPPVGEGANQAMLDGAELALALADGDRAEAVKRYETAMFERATAAAKLCDRVFEMLLAPDALQRVLKFFGG